VSARAVSHPLRVAIIDDETDVLTFLRAVFEDRGFEVATCGQPSTALELLREFHPDLVCLDLLMPEQMGVSLYAQIRHVPTLETVPVLILTGLDADEVGAALCTQASGVPAPDGTVEKPIDVTRLFGAVDAVLTRTAGGAA
jgi:two-component system alkaline phosphatase synthesis response regulator PhoP